MKYNFLNDSSLSAYHNKELNESLFEKFGLQKEDIFLLTYNNKVVNEVFEFLNSDDKVLIINGFMGSGKSVILDILPHIINENVLYFKNEYYPATHLDDILLSLFTAFSVYHNKKLIVLPKVDSSVFSEKINTYIKSFDNPMMFVFDSFEFSKMSEEGQKDILDFISYLKNFENIKIVIASRTFDEEDLPEGVKSHTTAMKLIEKNIFVDLIESEGIIENDFQVETIYKNTKGHYLYISLLIGLLKLLNLTISSFLNEYSKRNSTFSEFLIYKVLGLIPDRFLRLLCFMSFVRHGISENFIVRQNFASKEDILYLKNRMIITEESGLFWFKDYMKNELIKSIDKDVRAKIHQYLYDLYDSQLPKKPSQRDILISRATMRAEMDFHKNTITKESESKALSSENMNFSYVSYAKGVQYEWQFENSPLGSLEDYKPAASQIKNEKSGRFELSQEELVMLNSTDKENSEIGNFLTEQTTTQYQTDNMNAESGQISEKYKEKMEDWIQIAQKAEELHDYNSSILSYKRALDEVTDPLYAIKKPLLMTKLAICYKKIQQPENAIQEFEKVYQIYAANEPTKANYILLNIAQVYSETYKFSQAKSIYERILDSNEEKPTKLIVRVYLDLSELEDNNANIHNAVSYCEKAVIEVKKIEDLQLSSEVYFKYALLMDDSNNISSAIKYYQKCIDESNDIAVNQYLSSAYSNLASIYAEQNNQVEAIKFYNLSIETDNAQNNYEGLYFGYSKLARLYQSQSAEKTMECLVKSLDAAKKLDDYFYSASAYLDLGDFYYNKKMDERALKAYHKAKSLIMQQPNEENIQRVNVRINDLKVRLGDNKFIQLMKEFQKK